MYSVLAEAVLVGYTVEAASVDFIGDMKAWIYSAAVISDLYSCFRAHIARSVSSSYFLAYNLWNTIIYESIGVEECCSVLC